MTLGAHWFLRASLIVEQGTSMSFQHQDLAYGCHLFKSSRISSMSNILTYNYSVYTRTLQHLYHFAYAKGEGRTFVNFWSGNVAASLMWQNRNGALILFFYSTKYRLSSKFIVRKDCVQLWVCSAYCVLDACCVDRIHMFGMEIMAEQRQRPSHHQRYRCNKEIVHGGMGERTLRALIGMLGKTGYPDPLHEHKRAQQTKTITI